MKPERRLSRSVAWLACVLALLLAGCAAPPRPPGLLGAVQGSGARTLDAQLQAIVNDPAARDERRVIFVGAALHSREDVFDHDVALMADTLGPVYGAAWRSVLLSNLRVYAGDRALPLATIEHLDQVFETLAAAQRPNDRYIVLLSSHGGPNLLQVEQAARYRGTPRLLSKDKIGDWAHRLGERPAWWVISACYAGSHLQQELPPRMLVMTAAAADRQSFGCGAAERNTWFIDALAGTLREAAPPAARQPIDALWQRTLQRVALREQERRLQPSQPALHVGPEVALRFQGPLGDF